jgi:hypothetical protein
MVALLYLALGIGYVKWLTHRRLRRAAGADRVVQLAVRDWKPQLF